MVYLHLFHGRKTIDKHMPDWGENGPTFGPFGFVHTTYSCDIKLGQHEAGDCGDLTIVDGMVRYDGIYYGDWSVFGHKELEADKIVPVPFEQAKADMKNKEAA